MSASTDRGGAAVFAAHRLFVSPEQGVVPEWNAEEDDVLVCRAVRAETHDVKTFIFSARAPRLFRYKPGQFLTLDLTIDGRQVNRCYTISSSPTRPNLIAVTTKRFAGGVVSPWMHDHLKPGMEIRALGPMGEFNCVDHASPNGKYLLLSAGSGITPLMSMARSFHDLALETDTVFLHSARSPADIIFREEQAMLSRGAGFRALAICEHDSPGEPWGGYRGRLSLAMLEVAVPDFREREVFVCGPAPYMAGARALLQQGGFDMNRYHQESFNFEELAAEDAALAPPANTDDAVKTFKVEFTKSRRTVEVSADQNVLAAARAAGMRLPSSCTRGLCGTCKSKLVSGEVSMQHQGGIRQREIDQGLVLICCAKPLSDLVIER
ncbi:FAD-binding oxidoreductase [Acidisoma sp. 7E03]